MSAGNAAPGASVQNHGDGSPRAQTLTHRRLVLGRVAHLPILARQAQTGSDQRSAGLQMIAVAEHCARRHVCVVQHIQHAERVEHIAFDHPLRCVCRVLAEIAEVIESVIGQQPHRQAQRVRGRQKAFGDGRMADMGEDHQRCSGCRSHGSSRFNRTVGKPVLKRAAWRRGALGGLRYGDRMPHAAAMRRASCTPCCLRRSPARAPLPKGATNAPVRRSFAAVIYWRRFKTWA